MLRLANKLNEMAEVVYAEPRMLSVLEQDVYTPDDLLYSHQTYLPLIDWDAAWDTLDNTNVNLRGGTPEICIAVLDIDGVTPNHPDLPAPLTGGSQKVLMSVNFASMFPENPTDGFLDHHGTQVAGMATAAFDNNRGIAGVAPNCHVIGARLPFSPDDLESADVILWTAGLDAGNTDPAFPAFPGQLADMIINSWGSGNSPLSHV
ncbi:S8 family serine peptidase [Actibacterium sp. 188UL27-1]|uniref:S8 family serine peptidase n=1 Tax=Actibacterium sp. 188UL27-1 TaxID=2786961 RepID=UPI00195A0F78|nr:S8 family serine peptidase [Actibacterium sp. 188UL27-1]MBM7070129.1 S8 family serine peptidase [Actibacterium sp. 188UL27-1]